MGNIIDMKEWIAEQEKNEPLLDFGKPYDELNDKELRLAVDTLSKIAKGQMEAIKSQNIVNEHLMEKVEHLDKAKKMTLKILDNLIDLSK